ncbi:UNVERIFIED_CONTAM: hypothetical protein NCL1_46677 [Trichonephila clavipes]
MITRCLKCGKEHPTKECDIKEKQENPYCINCNAYGHTACYTKCPNFPKPGKGSPLLNRNSKKFTSNNVVEGISFASMVSGNKNNNDPPPYNNSNNKSERQSTPQVSPSNEFISSDVQDVIALLKILKQILPDLKKTKDFKQQALMLMDSKAHKPNRVLTFLTSLHVIGPSRTGHTSSSTKPGTTSQGTFRSRYGMDESAQVPVHKMSREVVEDCFSRLLLLYAFKFTILFMLFSKN